MKTNFKFVNTIDDLNEIVAGVHFTTFPTRADTSDTDQKRSERQSECSRFLPGKIGAYCNYLGGAYRIGPLEVGDRARKVSARTEKPS